MPKFYNSEVRLWACILILAGAIAATVPAAALPQTAVAPAADPDLRPAITRLESTLAGLNILEQGWRATDEKQSHGVARQLERIAAIEEELAAADEGSPKASAIYDRVVPLVRDAITEAETAIDRARRPSELPSQNGRTDLEGITARPFGAEPDNSPSSRGTEAIEQLRRQVGERFSELHELELELRLADFERAVGVAGRLYLLRLAALEALPLERSISVHSWRQEGRGAVELEVDALELLLRIQRFRSRGLVEIMATKLRSLVAVFAAGWLLARIFLVVLLWRWAQRERGRFLGKQRCRVEAIDDPQWRNWALRLVDLLAAVAPWSIYLLALVGFRWAVGPSADEMPYFVPLLITLATYGIYRLTADTAVTELAAGMESAGISLESELRASLRRSVRWVARMATVVLIILWIYSFRLGKGVLYSKIFVLGWLFVGLVILLVIIPWRQEIRETSLGLRAHGWIADLLRKTEGRWAGYLVSPIAFIWLCGRGLVGLFRGIAFSFQRTRSATAFLSRRRLERVAAQRGYADGRTEDLPAAVAQAFDEKLSIEDLKSVSGLPGLHQAWQAAEAWCDGETGGSLLLAGEEGLGKTALLGHISALEGESTRARLEERILSPAKLRKWLAGELLSEPKESISREGLIDGILGGPKRIIILENAENLFLATVNGYRALSELGPVIDATRKRVFWLLVMKGLAWNHLRAAGKELTFLRRKLVLGNWDEDQIQALLDRRLEIAGVEVSYADLMGRENREEDEISRNRLGRKAYFHLLWDYSGGNPQIALHFYARSLETDSEGRITVRVFRAPLQEDLVEAGDEALFLLAAVMRHGSLNSRQAAITTDYTVGRVEGLFLQLLDLGTVAEEGGFYQVTTDWRATVLRVLRRRNILIS